MPRSTYTIGRSPSADIQTPADARSVSAMHAEVTITKDHRYYLTDRGSTNGTTVFRAGHWQTLQQDFVGLEEPVRLGAYETTLGFLLRTPAAAVTPEEPLSPPRPRRNPETGEIIEG
jgi:predicted component of type VI protein secretion system